MQRLHGYPRMLAWLARTSLPTFRVDGLAVPRTGLVMRVTREQAATPNAPTDACITATEAPDELMSSLTHSWH